MKTQSTKVFKKITALFIAVCLLLGSFPTNIFAEDVPAEAPAQESVTEEVAQEVTAEETVAQETVTAETPQPEVTPTPTAVPQETVAPAEETLAADRSATEENAEEETDGQKTAVESATEEAPAAAEKEIGGGGEVNKETAQEETDPSKRFTYRLLVGFNGATETRTEDIVLGTFENTVLLGFENASDLENAKAYYLQKAAFASVDGAVAASVETSAPTAVDTASASAQAISASIEENPFSEAAGTDAAPVNVSRTIALIDTGASGANVISAYSVLGEQTADDNGHGNALAQIIATENPNAKIISIKALDANGKGSVASVYAAIKLAVNANADIIALPFSARGASAAIEAAVNEATAAGIQVVAAAGNDAGDAAGFCPANIASAITVGALQAEGEIADFTNRGASVDAWVIADSTSAATAIVAAGLADGKSVEDYRLDVTGEESDKTDEEAEEFETAYKETTDDLVDGGVYIIRLRKAPKKAMVPSSGSYSDGNKFVLSAADKPEDIDAQFKLQKINYNFYLKSRRDTNYILSPEGGKNNLGQNGQKVHQWKKASSNYKDFDQWYMQRNGNYYRISNGANTGMHLQTEGSNTDAFTTIHLWNATSGTQGDWIFERVYYTVRFNPNGGSGSAYTQKFWQEEKKALTANKFSRTGYTFKNWKDGKSTPSYYSNKQTVQTLTTTNAQTWNLWAQWTPNTYTVKFDGNGSTSGSMSNMSYTYDVEKALTANGFNRVGYTFNGWNTKADGTGTSYANSAKVKNLTATNNGTVTLYAQWKPITYTVAYQGNGNTAGTMANDTHTYDTAKNLTNNAFTKTGYSFSGWNTAANGTGTAYANGASVKNLRSSSGTYTLYAQWKANDYALTLDQQHATTAGTEAVYYTYDTASYYADEAHENAMAQVLVPTRTGYVFGGYYSAAHGGGTQYITADGQFTNDPYKLTGATLYAKWTANTYTVSMDANGGRLAGAGISTSTEEKDSAQASYDSAFNINHPVREGYSFTGWTISGMDETSHVIGTSTTEATDADEVKDTAFNNLRAESGTVSFLANWEANTYTVRFDANGGTLAAGIDNPYIATYDESFSADAPSRPGYVFMGWKVTGMEGENHKIGGTTVSGTSYTYEVSAADETVGFKNLRALKGEAEITAIWADDTYKVQYDLAGGTHSDVETGTVKSYKYNASFHLAHPSRAGYKFTGWTVSGMDAGTTHLVGGQETDAESVTAVLGNTFCKLSAEGGTVTLAATWEAENITIVLNAGQADSSDHTKQINYTYENADGYYADADHTTDLAKIEAPTRAHYTFTGYYEAEEASGTPVIPADGTIPAELDHRYASATNLYAGWEPLVYTITLSQDGASVQGAEKVFEKYGDGIYADDAAASAVDAIEVPTKEVTLSFETEGTSAAADVTETAPFLGFYDGDSALIGAGGQLLPAFATDYFTADGTLTAKWDKAAITLPAANERAGYSFTGWYKEATGGEKVGMAGDVYLAAADQTLYAQWTKDPELHYDGNENTAGAMADESIATGKTFTPASCAYTRTGYHFTAWNTKADGSGMTYEAGVKATWTEELAEGETFFTLYAQWAPNRFKEIRPIADQKYTGVAITPSVKVIDENGNVVDASAYELTWTANVNVGTAQVFATAKADGDYQKSPSVSQSFTIKKADAEYFEVAESNYTGIYDGTAHTVKASAKTEDEGHAYRIGYGRTESEAKTAAEAATVDVTNAGYAVKEVADTGDVYYYIIPENYAAFGGVLHATVTPKALTVSDLTAETRAYDGTMDVTLNTMGASLDGICDGDDVTLNAAEVTATITNKNAGTHKVGISGLAISGEDADNYTFTQPTDVTMEITKRPVSFSWAEGSYRYDGNAKVYQGASIADGVIDGEDVRIGTYADNVKTDAGNYTAKVVSLTGDDSANYIPDSASATNGWTIAKATNSINVTMDDWTFGQEAKDPVLSGVAYGAENVQYTYYTYEDCEDWWKTEPSDNGSTTVGGKPTYANYSYWVKATIPGNENYETVSAKDEFRIEQAEVRVRPNEASSVRGQEPLSAEKIGYQIVGDMLPGDKEKLASLIEIKLAEDFNKDVAAVYATESDWKEDDDDDYDYHAYDYISKNYDVGFDNGVYTVTRSDAKVKASDYYGVYDGKPHSAEVSVEGDDSAVIYYLDPNSYDDDLMTKLGWVEKIYDTKDEEEFREAYDEAEAALEASSCATTTKPTRTNAGVTGQFRFYVLTDQSIPDIIEGYGLIDISPAPLTVNVKDKTIAYGDEAANDGFTYEGFVNGETEATALDASGLSYAYSGYAAGSDAGTYSITASGITANNGNYEIAYKPGTLTVTPRVAELTWSTPAEFNYNGTERIVTATVNNAYGSDSIQPAAYEDNAKTAKGEYTAKAIALTGDKAKNYTLAGSKSATHPWKINEFDNQIDLSMADWTYGDAASAPEVTAQMDADKATFEYFKDADCKVKTTVADGAGAEGGKPANAGSYFVKASLATSDAYEGSEATAAFTIQKRAITIQADSKASTFGESIKPLTYQMSGTIAGSDDLAITLSTEATSSSPAKEYPISVHYTEDANYDVTVIGGTYTITKAKMNVMARGYVGAYDGQPHAATVLLDPQTEGRATVYYAAHPLDAQNYEAASTDPMTVTRTNVGETTVYYYVASAYYDGEPAISGSVDIVIEKIPLTVTAKDQRVIYGDDATDNGVTYEGFIEGDTEENALTGELVYDYDGYQAGSDIGDYVITPSGLTSTNYELRYESGTLTVEKRPVEFDWDENSFSYDSQKHSPKALVRNAVGTDDVQAASYEGIEKTDVGAYVAQVTSLSGDKAGNYALFDSEKTSSHHWKIVKAKNSWQEAPAISDWTYGKAASVPASRATFGADEVRYSYKKAGLSGLLDSYTEEVPTEAGNYVMRASVPGTDNYKALEGTVNFKILPAEITISADNKSSEYRHELVTLSYTVGGDYVAGDELGVVLDSTVSQLSSVGDYEISVRWANNPNYSASLKNGTYTITKGYLSLTAKDVTATYDGRPHGIDVKITKPSLHDATVWYAATEITPENLHTVSKTDDPLDASVTQVEVGEKTVYYYAESENFEKDPDEGDAIYGSRTVTVTKAPLTVQTANQSITYGDLPDAGKPAAANAENGISYTVPAGCVDDLDISALDYDYGYEQYKDVGEYSVTAKGISSRNYEISYTPGTLTVEQYTLSFDWESEQEDKTDFGYQYDGEKHAVYALPKTLNGDELDALTYTDNEKTEAGDYTAKVTALPTSGKGKNYRFDPADDTVTQNWGIEQAENSWNVEPAIEDWVYGTTAKTPTAEASFGEVSFSYRPSASESEDDWTSEVPTKAGEYQLRAVVEETHNYKGLVGYEYFEIERAKILVKPSDQTSVYLDELCDFAYTVEGREGDDFKEGDALVVRYTCTDEEGQAITKTSHVGDYTITAEVTNEEALNNYDIAYENGRYSITKAEIAYEATGYSGKYDGQGHGISVVPTETEGAEKAQVFYSLKDFNELIGADIIEAIQQDTSGTSVEDLLYRFDPTEVIDPETEEVTKGDLSEDVSDETPLLKDVEDSAEVYFLIVSENYKLQMGSKVVTITKAPLTVKAKDKEITYGEAPADDGVSYEGFVNGENEEVLSGSAAYTHAYARYGDVGTYKITPSGLMSDNYDITFETGTLTVSPKAVTFAWPNEAESSFVYSGKNESVTAKVTNAENGDELLLDYQYNVKKDVGTYTAEVTGLAGDKAKNYVIAEKEATATHDWKITKKALTITANDHTITYGDAPANAGVSYKGFVEGETESVLGGTAAYTYDYKQYGDVGTYTITPAGLTSGNYDITFETGELTVKERPIKFSWPAREDSEFVWEEDEFEYDGKFHTVTATIANAVNGDEEKIELNYVNPADATDVTNRKQHVGLYTATIFGISGDKAHNYVLETGEASASHPWKIAKAELTITANDHTITYGDAPINNGVIYEGFVEGEDESVLTVPVAYEIDYEQFQDIEEDGFAIKTTEADARDYKITFVPGRLYVEPKAITREMLDDPEDFSYDGEKKAPTIKLHFQTADENGEEVTYTLVEGKDYEVDGAREGTAFGTYDFTVKAMGNFIEGTEESWRINGEKERTEETIGEGTLVVETDIHADDTAISVSGLTPEVALALLTEEERALVEAGETALVYLEVDEVEGLVEEDAIPTDEKLRELGLTACLQLDIKLWKKIGHDPAKQVHDMGDGEVTITAAAPEAYEKAAAGYERSFTLIRAHEGEATVLAGPSTSTTLRFATGKFSGYTLAYQDTKLPEEKSNEQTDGTKKATVVAVKTTDESNTFAWATLFIMALALGALAVSKRLNYR